MAAMVAQILAQLNLYHAATIYLSLRGWLVVLEPSGIQLMMHLIFTAPVTLALSLWFFFLGKAGRCSKLLWKINVLGLLIPVISVQSGVTYYGYDLAGLALIALLSISLLVVLVADLHAAWRKNWRMRQ